MYNLVRKWLFNQDAERSHDWTLGMLRRFANTPLSLAWRQRLPAKPVTVMGIEFPNLPVLQRVSMKMRVA